ncbi:MAG: hypothetical protein HY558_06875, partial [Euryarchaeota archaeon]|nr:hypothetical protein [Euryarchaeota archaeon]
MALPPQFQESFDIRLSLLSELLPKHLEGTRFKVRRVEPPAHRERTTGPAPRAHFEVKGPLGRTLAEFHYRYYTIKSPRLDALLPALLAELAAREANAPHYWSPHGEPQS